MTEQRATRASSVRSHLKYQNIYDQNTRCFGIVSGEWGSAFSDRGKDKRAKQEERPLTRSDALSRLSAACHTGQATVLGRQYSMPYREGNG